MTGPRKNTLAEPPKLAYYFKNSGDTCEHLDEFNHPKTDITSSLMHEWSALFWAHSCH